MCKFLEKEAAIGSLFKGRLRERKKGRRFILAEETERAKQFNKLSPRKKQ